MPDGFARPGEFTARAHEHADFRRRDAVPDAAADPLGHPADLGDLPPERREWLGVEALHLLKTHFDALAVERDREVVLVPELQPQHRRVEGSRTRRIGRGGECNEPCAFEHGSLPALPR